ncbi:hypothetical protein JKF63_04628 [Porcisia hertigi]|uniref:Cullin family profile domain-containing protein n=1 Tax=Porcisia hertigi TaxID=2761500 RepID=A0A836ITM7_9TRYP|nr:hypothetical protein JKF63_04628 [Porcisia hertigi]
MTMLPCPLLPSFQVTLLPEQPLAQEHQVPAKVNSALSTPSLSSSPAASIQMHNQASAKAMLHAILDMAADCTTPQRRFSGYSPEAVLRSVRALVDDGLGASLVEELRSASRAYAQRCVTVLAAQLQQLPPITGSGERVTNSDTKDDEEVGALLSQATLGSVQILSQLVSYWDRLQQGLVELSYVWVYADQWCSAQIGNALPRSLSAAATQEVCEVLRGDPEFCETALEGYVAVLKAELAADTEELLSACRSARASHATEILDKHIVASPASAIPSKYMTPQLASVDSASLAVLTCPPSLTSLDKPLRQRLLRLFTQLTLATQNYAKLVEPTVVSVVRSHYERVAHRLWGDDIDAGFFFLFCDAAVKHIGSMSATLLHVGITPMLVGAIQSSVISRVGSEVLKRDFVFLVEQQAYDSLRLAWRLLSASEGVRSSPIVAGLFHEYLIDCGQQIMEELVPFSTKVTPAAAQVAARERPFLGVRHLLGLLEHGSCIVTKCFAECEKDFKVALHEDLQTILEAYPQAFSEQLAAYHDAIMREVGAGRLPVGPSKSAALVAVEGESDDVDDKGDGLSLPLRRRRVEGALPSLQPRVLAPSLLLDRAEEDAKTSLGKDELTTQVVDGPVRGDILMGAAALRHAPPLPAEVEEATSVLRRIAYIYSYHPKKSLFEAAYWRDFAKRCLHAHRRLNSTAENAFICFLRDICGLSFTAKFEGMLTDLTSSTELTAQYKTWAQEQEESQQQQQQFHEDGADAVTVGSRVSETKALDAHLFILTQSYWPEYSPMPINLYIPPAVQALTHKVEKFYTSRFPNRHLKWQHPLSNATLLTRLTPQSSLLMLTGTYTQCILLMQLDALYDRGVTSVTLKALCDAVGIDMSNTESLCSLQGLCHPRFRLVLREAAAAGVQQTSAEPDYADDANDTRTEEASAPPPSTLFGSTTSGPLGHTLVSSDVLRLNLSFTSATSKVLIPHQARLRTVSLADLDNPNRVGRTADNGSHLIEVAIVSCLKAQRTINHAALVSAVAERVPFPVTTAALKKAIDKMIERGFVVRRGGNTYVYSA